MRVDGLGLKVCNVWFVDLPTGLRVQKPVLDYRAMSLQGERMNLNSELLNNNLVAEPHEVYGTMGLRHWNAKYGQDQ